MLSHLIKIWKWKSLNGSASFVSMFCQSWPNGSNRSFQKHNWTWFSDIFDLKMLRYHLSSLQWKLCTGGLCSVAKCIEAKFVQSLFSSSFCGFIFTFKFNFFEALKVILCAFSPLWVPAASDLGSKQQNQID